MARTFAAVFLSLAFVLTAVALHYPHGERAF